MSEKSTVQVAAATGLYPPRICTKKMIRSPEHSTEDMVDLAGLFNMKSPVTVLAADLDANLVVNGSPHGKTPRRCLLRDLASIDAQKCSPAAPNPAAVPRVRPFVRNATASARLESSAPIVEAFGSVFMKSSPPLSPMAVSPLHQNNTNTLSLPSKLSTKDENTNLSVPATGKSLQNFNSKRPPLAPVTRTSLNKDKFLPRAPNGGISHWNARRNITDPGFGVKDGLGSFKKQIPKTLPSHPDEEEHVLQKKRNFTSIVERKPDPRLFTSNCLFNAINQAKNNVLAEQQIKQQKDQEHKPTTVAAPIAPSSPSVPRVESVTSRSLSSFTATNSPPVKMRRTQSHSSASKPGNDFFSSWPLSKVTTVGHGEGSILPFVETGKDALRRISSETLIQLLDGQFKDKCDEYYIIDCRFPYEFDGGHIVSARNINSPNELEQLFFSPPITDKKVVIIFHCEFSSQRAPRMALHLRNHDRHLNLVNYPQLHYPEIYILNGGYREFFADHQDRCTPQNYIRMLDDAYKEDCKREMGNHKRQFRKSFSESFLGS
ncbi:cell division cycle- protein [Quaeritorhiza haematococci]|nr:cell division cycle- protein [Quaeritorhiza haematococci]